MKKFRTIVSSLAVSHLLLNLYPLHASDSDIEVALLAPSRVIAMNPYEEALEIAQSRFEFYKTRHELLSGTSPESRAYQQMLKQEGSTILTTNGRGWQAALASLTNPNVFNEVALEESIEANRDFQRQWSKVEQSIVNLNKKWSPAILTELTKLRYLFAMKTWANTPAEGFKVPEDHNYIATDVNDFDAIITLLKQTFSYLQEQEIEKNKLILEKAQQKSANKSIDELVAWIEGKSSSKGLKAGKKKSRKRKNQTPAISTSNVSTEEKSFEKNTETALKESIITQPLVKEEVSQTDKNDSLKPMEPLQKKIDNLEKVEEIQQVPSQNIIIEEKFTENDNFLSQNTNQQKIAINNPKALRAQAKLTGLAQRPITLDKDPSIETKPTLKLSSDHHYTLTQILKAASHPPLWDEALKSVSAIIKQWGGSIRGDRGNGSAVEFWIYKTRFLVDATHGNNEMYRAQMKFMAKGLQRAGITLDLLAQLEK
jgi:hypothetical protein